MDYRVVNTAKHMGSAQNFLSFLPVALEDMGARFEFLLLENNSHVFMPPDGIPVKVTAIEHNHPGSAYSYRYERDGYSIVFSTDIEHGDTLNEKLVELARDADILIHDGQYSSDELALKKGWGHSSWEQAIEVALQANVKKLVLCHHDPDHDDDFLSGVEKECQRLFANVSLAREGMVITV